MSEKKRTNVLDSLFVGWIKNKYAEVEDKLLEKLELLGYTSEDLEKGTITLTHKIKQDLKNSDSCTIEYKIIKLDLSEKKVLQVIVSKNAIILN